MVVDELFLKRNDARGPIHNEASTAPLSTLNVNRAVRKNTQTKVSAGKSSGVAISPISERAPSVKQPRSSLVRSRTSAPENLIPSISMMEKESKGHNAGAFSENGLSARNKDVFRHDHFVAGSYAQPDVFEEAGDCVLGPDQREHGNVCPSSAPSSCRLTPTTTWAGASRKCRVCGRLVCEDSSACAALRRPAQELRSAVQAVLTQTPYYRSKVQRVTRQLAEAERIRRARIHREEEDEQVEIITFFGMERECVKSLEDLRREEHSVRTSVQATEEQVWIRFITLWRVQFTMMLHAREESARHEAHSRVGLLEAFRIEYSMAQCRSDETQRRQEAIEAEETREWTDKLLLHRSSVQLLRENINQLRTLYDQETDMRAKVCADVECAVSALIELKRIEQNLALEHIRAQKELYSFECRTREVECLKEARARVSFCQLFEEGLWACQQIHSTQREQQNHLLTGETKARESVEAGCAKEWMALRYQFDQEEDAYVVWMRSCEEQILQFIADEQNNRYEVLTDEEHRRCALVAQARLEYDCHERCSAWFLKSSQELYRNEALGRAETTKEELISYRCVLAQKTHAENALQRWAGRCGLEQSEVVREELSMRDQISYEERSESARLRYVFGEGSEALEANAIHHKTERNTLECKATLTRQLDEEAAMRELDTLCERWRTSCKEILDVLAQRSRDRSSLEDAEVMARESDVELSEGSAWTQLCRDVKMAIDDCTCLQHFTSIRSNEEYNRKQFTQEEAQARAVLFDHLASGLVQITLATLKHRFSAITQHEADLRGDIELDENWFRKQLHGNRLAKCAQQSMCDRSESQDCADSNTDGAMNDDCARFLADCIIPRAAELKRNEYETNVQILRELLLAEKCGEEEMCELESISRYRMDGSPVVSGTAGCLTPSVAQHLVSLLEIKSAHDNAQHAEILAIRGALLSLEEKAAQLERSVLKKEEEEKVETQTLQRVRDELAARIHVEKGRRKVEEQKVQATHRALAKKRKENDVFDEKFEHAKDVLRELMRKK